MKSEGILENMKTNNKTQNYYNYKKYEKTYRLDTNSCKIIDLPLFDEETRGLFKNDSKTIYECSHKRMVKIKRFEETSILLNWNDLGYTPACYYRELSRGKDDHDYLYGKYKLLLFFNLIIDPNFLLVVE